MNEYNLQADILRKQFKNDSHFKPKNIDLLTKLYSQMNLSSEKVVNLKDNEKLNSLNNSLNSIQKRKNTCYLNKEEFELLL